MEKLSNTILLIDFDSTFISTEGLEELAAISLQKHPTRNEILTQIQQITADGMEGKIPFDESLKKRIQLLSCTKSQIEKAAKVISKKVSVSIKRNKEFFKENAENIYIISGGFREMIEPILTDYGMGSAHIFANTFVYDDEGNVTGVDTKNPMSQQGGKIKVVQSLNVDKDIYVIGDGYTDYEIRKNGFAKKFIAFTENVQRESVIKNADSVVASFDEFLYMFGLPRSLSYPKNRIKVLLLEKIHQDAVALFEREGYQVEYCESSLSEDDLIGRLQDVSILGIRSKTRITTRVLENAPHLQIIGVFAIGINQIAVPEATKRGICIFNAPYSNTRSVAEMVLGEIIMLSRKVFEKSTLIHNGTWDKSSTYCHEVRGKKLGIIGYGHIGSQVSVLAEALGMQVYFYNTSERLAFGNAIKCSSMQEVLSIADVVTLHVSGKKENHNLIDAKAFHAMKDGVIFLNASRGFVVDIDALVTNIKSGKVRGCAIDVYPKEPEKNGDSFTTPLQNLPNVILTPHLGSGTQEAQQNIANYVPNKIIEFMNVGNTDMSINIPNLQLPPQGNTHRILHIHKNIPGILSQINALFAQNTINIVGQYLKTNEEIGYVITDIEKGYDGQIVESLKQIPDTIRVRVLY